MNGDIVLGENQYGKAECRLVRITRDTPVHEIEDLNVTTQLRGDFTACHTDGDNSQVVATDTQKNTVYAFAREHGIGSPEEFLVRLGRHFVDGFEWQPLGSTVQAQLDKFLPPSRIEGIEVYLANSPHPIRFETMPFSNCGAIVIWTR